MTDEYLAFLRSPAWDRIKRRKASYSPRYCAACLSLEHLVCHHLVYRDDPEDIDLRCLIWLCRRCHDLLHAILATTHAWLRGTCARRKLKTVRLLRQALNLTIDPAQERALRFKLKQAMFPNRKRYQNDAGG